MSDLIPFYLAARDAKQRDLDAQAGTEALAQFGPQAGAETDALAGLRPGSPAAVPQPIEQPKPQAQLPPDTAESVYSLDELYRQGIEAMGASKDRKLSVRDWLTALGHMLTDNALMHGSAVAPLVAMGAA